MRHDPAVFVIGTDPAAYAEVRSAAHGLALACEAFATADAFFRAGAAGCPGCVVVEACSGGIDGLQLQERLTSVGATLPVIFLGTQSDLSLAVQAMRAGAVHFLEKPVCRQQIADAIGEALRLDTQRREILADIERCQEWLAVLEARGTANANVGAAGDSAAHARPSSPAANTAQLDELMRNLDCHSLDELVQLTLLVTRSGETTPAVRRSLGPPDTDAADGQADTL